MDKDYMVHVKPDESYLNSTKPFDYDSRYFEMCIREDGKKYLHITPEGEPVQDLVVPEVECGIDMFAGSNIETMPTLRDGIQNIACMFDGCRNLKITENDKIPDSVTKADFAFSDCDNIEFAPELSANLKSSRFMFSGCDKLREMPDLSDNIEDAEGMFHNCIRLAPDKSKLPESIKDDESIFVGCNNMAKVELESDIEGYYKDKQNDEMSQAKLDKNKLVAVDVVENDIEDNFEDDFEENLEDKDTGIEL